jgi:hypothetical protein
MIAALRARRCVDANRHGKRRAATESGLQTHPLIFNTLRAASRAPNVVGLDFSVLLGPT